MGTLKGKSVFKGIGWHCTDLAVKIKKIPCTNEEDVTSAGFTPAIPSYFSIKDAPESSQRKCKMWHLSCISSCFTLTHVSLFFLFPSCPAGEICAFNIHGLEAPFEAVVLNGTSGEGQLRARGLVDCEQQKEYTFIIQAHDCGSGPGGTEGKKSHKWVKIGQGWQDSHVLVRFPTNRN